MKSRINDLITVFLIQLVLTLPFYTANVYGLTISNVKVTKVTSSSATVEWNTDNISNGKVRYGKTTSLGFTQRHDNFIDNHTVTLFNGIDSDTSYFFIVESTDLAGSTAIDNNSNNFYTFKTTDITPPPQVTGLRAVSATSNSIFLTWDALNLTDLNRYIIYKNRIPVANSTTNSFNDTGLEANKDYNYKVSAVDNSNNEGPQSDTLIASTSAVDSIAPIISSIDVVTITDTTARITWLTNENATSIVLYGVNKTDKIKSSSDLEINHTIVIDGLTKNAKVLFIVKSCDSSNNCANFSTQSFTAGRDTKPPFINLSIPRCVNRRVVDIVGSTEPFSSVTLFVNNMNIPKRSLSSNEVGISGKFIFSQIQLEKDNVIKVVMVDKSGNKAQKIFETSIDTEDPIVQLSEIPSLTSRTNVSISGSVNEPVTIKVFVDTNVNESSVPSKITGLNTTKVGQNSIELRWDEIKSSDFSHYVVYRSDIGAIATTKPSNFNLFIDALVDSGKSYTYQVSAVNILGREGPKSEPITVTTQKGGAILNLNPPLIDPLEDFRKPLLFSNATATFNFGVRLTKGDGTYKIKTIIEDCAENSVIIQKDVTLDTKKPEVKITSPPSGAFLFENVANEIDVIGITKPNARVHLFVDRTPFSFFNQSFEISGLPNEIQNLPEAQLDAKCRSAVSASFCRTGADFSVDADSQGNFKFERVDLTVIFGGAARLREVPPTEFRDTQLNPEAQESRKATLVVIATDKTGQRGVATHAVRIGTCWSGNQSWDIIPLALYQSPTFLSTERMAEGTETIYFYFNYSYIGRGTSSVITGVSMTKACSTRELLDPRFNISCQIMQSGNTPRLLNPPENTVSYSAMQLNRFPGMDRFLENDWKSFLKAINKELTFPLRISIRYKHDTDNDGNLEEETQRTCEEVTYVVDDTIIDPRKVLPDWLLFDFVDFLQSSIETLTELQEKLSRLIEFVAVGCLSSFGLNLVLGIYRRWVSFADEKAYLVFKAWSDFAKVGDLFQKNPLKPANNNEKEKQDCEELIKTIATKNKGSFKLKYMTNADLRKCFPTTASAWEAEAKAYQFMRWSCDRIFGHSAPSKWTETEKEEELRRKVETVEGCAADQSSEGQPLTAEPCTDFARKNPKYSKAAELTRDEKCVLVLEKQDNKRIETVYTIGDPISEAEGLYKLNYLDGTGRRSEVSYALKSKKAENKFLTARSQSCEEICGGDTSKEGEKLTIKDRRVEFTKKGKNSKVGAGCAVVEECRSLNVKDSDKYELGDMIVESASPRGYTIDCFYKGDGPTNVVSENPAQRVECCCIQSKDSKISTKYYQPDDLSPYGTRAHESKTVPDKEPQQKAVPGKNEQESYSDMQWSYRYWKEKFEARSKANEKEVHNEYNKYRYIEGRDLPACFGQNNLLYQAFGEERKILVVDPFKQHEAALQCVHLAGINNRMQFIKNLMQSMSTCLIQVRTTGRGDAGACKELFTQHVCGSIWQILRFFVDKCTLSDIGPDFDSQSENIANYVKNGLKGIYEGITDLQSTVTEEYGNAKLNEILGTGEESIARKLCLAAFGYDWEINLDNIVDAAYSSPYATLVQAILPSREFLTVDPQTLKPKFEYKSSWVINPGCDFERYDVSLSCVGRNQLDQYPNIRCSTLGSREGYSCDCIDLADEKTSGSIASGKLKQNVLEDKKAIRVIREDNYRYDHIKFELRPDRKISKNIKPNCFPTGHDNGIFYFPIIDKSPRDIFDCRLDVASGSLICGEGTAFATRKGIGEILSMKINDIDSTRTRDLVFQTGEALKVDVEVRKALRDKCLKMEFDNEVQIVDVTADGIQPYSFTTKQLFLGTQPDINEPTGLSVQRINLGNNQRVTISVLFVDKSGSEAIEFEQDYIKIENEEINVNEIRNSKKIIKQGKPDEIEVRYDGQKIIVKKQGAEIAITNVVLQRDTAGRYLPKRFKFGNDEKEKDYPSFEGVISILVPQENLQTQTTQLQTKTLVVGLYHIKDDQERFVDASSCNLNDPVIGEGGKKMERRAAIRVERKAVDLSQQGPLINYKAPEKAFRKEDSISFSPVTIRHNSGVRAVDLACTASDGIPLTPVIGKRIGSDSYQFDFIPTNLNIAGRYKCEIRATANNDKSNSFPFSFDIQCGDPQKGYGFCRDSCFPPATPISQTLFDCGQEIGVCCTR